MPREISMKKIILVLSLGLCLSMVSFSANKSISPTNADVEDSGSCGDNATYTYGSGTLTIGGTGAINDSSPWSSYKNSITKVIIRSGITEIKNYAFSSLSNVTNLSLPESVKYIGYNAFYNWNSLPAFNVPSGIAFLDSNFYTKNTGTANINYPGTYSDFLTISNSLAGYGLDFEITCSDKTLYSRSLGNNYTIEKTAYITSSDGKFLGIKGSDNTSEISDYASESATPWYENRNSITEIRVDSIKAIGAYAFCSLTKLQKFTISYSLQEIRANAFRNVTVSEFALHSSSALTINANAFYSCNFSKLALPGSATIKSAAFSSCTLSEIYLSSLPMDYAYSTTKDYNSNCFSGRSVTIYYPETGYGGASITNATKTVRKTSGYYGGSSKWTFNASSGVLTITGTAGFTPSVSSGSNNPWYLFRTSITSIVISSSILTINSYAFEYCSNVTQVTLPSNIKSLTCNAFNNNSSLQEIYIPRTIGMINKQFNRCHASFVAYFEGTQADLNLVRLDPTYDQAFATLTYHPSTATCTQSGKAAYYDFQGYASTRLYNESKEQVSSIGNVPAHGHMYDDDWEVDIEPTYTTVGREYRICSLCGEVEYREVPKKTLSTDMQNLFALLKLDQYVGQNSRSSGDCSSDFANAKVIVLSLSSSDETLFKTSTDSYIQAGRERYEAWALSLHQLPYQSGSMGATLVNGVSNQNTLAVVAVILFIVSSLSITGFVFYKKRKHQ